MSDGEIFSLAYLIEKRKCREARLLLGRIAEKYTCNTVHRIRIPILYYPETLKNTAECLDTYSFKIIIDAKLNTVNPPTPKSISIMTVILPSPEKLVEIVQRINNMDKLCYIGDGARLGKPLTLDELNNLPGNGEDCE